MPKPLNEILTCSNDDEIREWFRVAPLEELEGFIAQSSPNLTIHKRAIVERDRRYATMARKPHWTITPGFIIAVLAMIFSAIAAWPVIQSWFKH